MHLNTILWLAQESLLNDVVHHIIVYPLNSSVKDDTYVELLCLRHIHLTFGFRRPVPSHLFTMTVITTHPTTHSASNVDRNKAKDYVERCAPSSVNYARCLPPHLGMHVSPLKRVRSASQRSLYTFDLLTTQANHTASTRKNEDLAKVCDGSMLPRRLVPTHAPGEARD